MLASFDPDYPEAPTLAVSPTSLSGRRFLIVTAPFGPFGRVLADALRTRGAEVSRMLFNAGDAFTWRRKGGVAFKADASRWPARLREMAGGYTDIIVFGEAGAYNQAVLRDSHRLGARVWVLENGYFRPDWVTIERNGVNGSSNLPRTRAAYAPPAPPIPVTRHIGVILPHHVINISLYHTVQILGGVFFPRYALPYTQHPLLQCLGHVRRYLGLMARSPGHCDTARIADRGPYFIACLQREGDAQLLRYSRYPDNTAFLSEVLSSFARHAPPDTRLVVKNHPLDPGLTDLAQITRILAVEHNLSDRVDFIDGGNLAQLCRASRGMIVNNSSAALSALGFHTPVKVLGEAFFDFDGLTDQKTIDAFWRAPTPPEPDLFTRFRAHVIARSQVNGNYHEPRGLRPTADSIAAVFAAPGRDGS